MEINKDIKIAVVGLGYVGLPLARLFATKFPVIGFDINRARVEELQKGHDSTLEVEDDVLQAVLLKQYPVPVKQLNGEVLELAGVNEYHNPHHATDNRQPTTDNRQLTTNTLQLTTYNRQPASSSPSTSAT